MKKNLDRIELFNKWAEDYNKSVEKSDRNNEYPFAGYTKIKHFIQQIVQKSNAKNILEMGIGTGEITFPLYENKCNITGVDFSENMIQKAKIVMPNATFIQANFTDSIKVLDGMYDVILFNYSIHHITIPEQIELISNLAKHVIENGTVIIGDVMTETKSKMDILAKLDNWDDEEYYPIVEQYKRSNLNHLFNIKFKQISHCSGVMVLEKVNHKILHCIK